MTAIDKMVEWLEENKKAWRMAGNVSVCPEAVCDQAIFYARLLAAEEAKEKEAKMCETANPLNGTALSPTAPASLVEELQDALDHDNGRTLWRCRLIEILSRYRPEHMDEGLREEMRKIADMGSCVGFKDLSIRGVIRELLSRHPAPKDRCEELVERLRRYANAGLFDGDTGGDSLIKVLSEFSKEAGKEGR